MKTTTNLLTAIVCGLVITSSISCGSSEENHEEIPVDESTNKVVEVIPTDVYDYCPIESKDFDSWFESGSVTKDGLVTPANSFAFPSDNTNCDFYKWSERMFLWVTSPTPEGVSVFDTKTFYDVSPEDADGNRTLISHVPGEYRTFHPTIRQERPQELPVLAHPRTGELTEIDTGVKSEDGEHLVFNEQGEEVEAVDISIDYGAVTFLDADGNPIEGAKPVFNEGINTESTVQQFSFRGKTYLIDAEGNFVNESEQGQAGGGAVLMAQNGGLVYYTLMVNDVFAVFKTMHPDASEFPSTQPELDEIYTYAAAMGIDITDLDALCMELKMSWIETQYVDNPKDYVQTKAEIPVYDKVSDEVGVKSGTKEAALALLGIHIVGNVAGHPEMLWSTFEHDQNVPLNTYSYINTNKDTTKVASTTSGKWLFAASGAVAPFNIEYMATSSDSIINDSIPNDSLMAIVAKSGYTISASNTLRDNPWGAVAGTVPNQNVQSAAQSNSEVISVNSNVMNLLAEGDIRANYIQIGNTWTKEENGSHLPTGEFPDGGNEVGTSRLANATMETYHQSFNCFVCHNSSTYTGLSHIFDDIQPLSLTLDPNFKLPKDK